MKPGFELQLQQTQRLIMTPELRQAITLLQLPVAELEEFIEQELLENPVLEAEPADDPEQPAQEPAIDPAQWLEYIGDEEPFESRSRSAAGMETSPEPAFSPSSTLQEHLLEQLRMAPLSAGEHKVGEFLVGSIDDAGYLAIEPAEAAAVLGAPERRVLKLLRLIQSFDPPGVGARSLRECLYLQWQSSGRLSPLAGQIIEDHLDDVAAGRLIRAAELLGVTPAQVQEAVDQIRTLDPKPGQRFGRPGDLRYVVPDVTVERVAGEYVIAVNDGPIPRLGISQHYRSLLRNGLDQQVRKFLEGKIQAALWLMKAVEQRRLTLYRVTEAVVRFQRGFFDHGSRRLVPLTLREVASALGLHESTVSRACSGKYVQTPQGLYELKFFFSSGVESANGPGVAAESVKRLIGDIVVGEDRFEPHSDLAIAGILREKGIQISRRTVAKYREEAGIQPSHRRKRY
jgi:RNA polymerase sigma-54 factor